MRADDSLVAGPAVSWLALRMAMVLIVAAAAALLIPLIGWYLMAVALALCAAIIPRTLAAWGSIACIVIGMALSEPDLARTMLAVLTVPLIHVLGSLTLVAAPGTLITLAALRPTAARLAVVQAVAQPLAVVAMLGTAQGAAVPWAAAAGGAALAAAAVLLIVRLARTQNDG